MWRLYVRSRHRATLRLAKTTLFISADLIEATTVNVYRGLISVKYFQIWITGIVIVRYDQFFNADIASSEAWSIRVSSVWHTESISVRLPVWTNQLYPVIIIVECLSLFSLMFQFLMPIFNSYFLYERHRAYFICSARHVLYGSGVFVNMWPRRMFDEACKLPSTSVCFTYESDF